MYWHQSHKLSPFKSIAPRQVAFTHDFAEILRRLFLLWRHNFVTWPDPTKFFSPKVAQRMPHKLWKISARSSKRCGVQLRKTHGGGGLHQPPPPLTGRGLNCRSHEQPTFGPQRYPKSAASQVTEGHRRLVEHGDNNYSLELLFSLWETNLSYRNRALKQQLCPRFRQLATLNNWRSLRRENFTQYALAGDLSNGVGRDLVKNLVRLVLAKYFLR